MSPGDAVLGHHRLLANPGATQSPVGAASAMMNDADRRDADPLRSKGIYSRREGYPRVRYCYHRTCDDTGRVNHLVGTSSNLLIAGIASGSGVEVGMFSFAIIALPVAIVGWAWLLFASPRAFRPPMTPREKEMTWRVEIPVSAKANGVGRRAGDLGVATTQEFRLLGIRREMAMLEPEEPIAAGDTMVFKPRRRCHRPVGQPQFRLAEQRLYAASVAPGEPGTINDLESHGKVDVVAPRQRISCTKHA